MLSVKDKDIIVVMGYPGSGKTTVAEIIEEETGGYRLSTDEVRKEIVSSPTYTKKETSKVYAKMISAAMIVPADIVILDGTFNKQTQRQAVVDGLDESVIRFTLVHCPDSLAKVRMEDRDSVIDADYDIRKKIKSEFEPLEREHIVIDNGGTLKQTISQVEEKLL